MASRRRSARSVRQSLASSTAERSRLPRYCSSFDFEAREQRERIGRRPGKAGEDAVVIEPANLAGALLDDGVAERDLPVAGQHGAIVPAHGQDGRRVEGRLHPCSVSHARRRLVSVLGWWCQRRAASAP